MINPQCISINVGTDCNFEDGSTIKGIKKMHNDFNKKNEELIDFIEEFHDYYGRDCLRLNTKTIMSNLDYDPLLIPKNFNVIMKGLKLGLEYILNTNVFGECPYLSLNRCLIHDFKPIGCKKFPYTKDKCLRKDNPFLSVCKGLKKMKEV